MTQKIQKNRKARRAESAEEIKRQTKNNMSIIKNHDNPYKEFRVLIATPCSGMVHADFAMCLAGLTSYNNANRIDTALTYFKGANIMQSRNHLAKEALRIGATHILFLDSDQTFPPYVAEQLLIDLKTTKTHIVGATVPKRVHPFNQASRDAEGNPFEMTPESSGIVESKELGTGTMMIAVEVFEKIGFPYFETYYKVDENGAKSEESLVGEDTAFCHKAAEVGYKAYCNLDLSKECAHIGEYKFDYTSKILFSDFFERRDELDKRSEAMYEFKIEGLRQKREAANG